jgi:predicted RNA binding protein YcfA (HicA-like mRNA interferase family)
VAIRKQNYNHMKLPRDIDASDLIKALYKFGYEPTRQTGSHIRLTIPNHDPIKIGTLNAILTEVAQHLGIYKQELIDGLF